MIDKSKRKTNILQKSFYARSTIEVAQDLLGKIVVRVINGTEVSGMIVETEAYTGDDLACHAHKGKTQSNRALFGPVGHAYIYFTYGMHFCFNAVARDAQHEAGGVLIRALEPLTGIEVMEVNRKMTGSKNLTNGPAKLTQALAITKDLYGHNLMEQGALYITDGPDQEFTICAAPRVGISIAQEVPWRFYLCDNPFVSRKS